MVPAEHNRRSLCYSHQSLSSLASGAQDMSGIFKLKLWVFHLEYGLNVSLKLDVMEISLVLARAAYFSNSHCHYHPDPTQKLLFSPSWRFGPRQVQGRYWCFRHLFSKEVPYITKYLIWTLELVLHTCIHINTSAGLVHVIFSICWLIWVLFFVFLSWAELQHSQRNYVTSESVAQMWNFTFEGMNVYQRLLFCTCPAYSDSWTWTQIYQTVKSESSDRKGANPVLFKIIRSLTP